MRNKYSGFCIRCGVKVEANKGHFEKVSKGTNHPLYSTVQTKWVVRCKDCVGKGHVNV